MSSIIPARYLKRYRLFMRVSIAVAAVCTLKVVTHSLHWEVLSLNPLFSGIVAANVFLMGFLLSGVLTDFKEAERLPGELACSLEVIANEARAIHRAKEAPAAKECFDHMLDLCRTIRDWFHKKRRTRDVMDGIDKLDEHFASLEGATQANFIVRLKQEQGNVRRTLVRIHTIRETNFISSGYIVAESTTLMLVVGLILAKIEPFHESLFFAGVITFLLVYMNLLIHDLDNPFGYYEEDSAEDVSLKPLDEVIAGLESSRPGAAG